MKKLFSIINFILCLELLVAPIVPQLGLLGTKAYASGCPAGLTMDTTLNRCLTSSQAAAILRATADCGTDNHACYRSNAEEALQKEQDADEDKYKNKEDLYFASSATSALAMGATLGVLIQTIRDEFKEGSCFASSFTAMALGASALLYGTLRSNFMHKKRLKKIETEWEKIVNPTGANGDKDLEREMKLEAQSKAFLKLAEAEDSMVKAAKTKRDLAWVAVGAFSASAIIAISELAAGTNPANWCKFKKSKKNVKKSKKNIIDPETWAGLEGVTASTSQKKDSLYAHYLQGSKPFILDHQFQYNLENSSDIASLMVNRKALDEKSQPSLEYYLVLKEAFSDESFKDPDIFETFKAVSVGVMANLNPVSSANAEEEEKEKWYHYEKPWVSVLGAAGTAALFGFIGKYLAGPVGRLSVSGALGAMSGLMAGYAQQQVKISTNRAELLRKMEADFNSAAGAIYACKSEDRSDPGKPTCYCYTADNQRNPNRGNSKICQELWTGKNLTAGNYTASSGEPRVCINQKSQVDAKCKCKASKSCMRVNLSGIKGLNAGTFSMISDALAPLGYLSNGGDPAGLNSASLENQAARMTAALSKLEQNPALKKHFKNKDKNEKALMAELTRASAGMTGENLFAGARTSAMPSNPAEAARMLEKEVKNASITTVGGDNSIANPVNNGGAQDLEFGLGDDQLFEQEGQIAEIMKENLDFGGNDINQGSNSNIFEVLSNRYQRSGMRRLFDEKGATQADKASPNDIVE